MATKQHHLQERLEGAYKRLIAQLESGVKTRKGTHHSQGITDPLTPFDVNRILKDMRVLERKLGLQPYHYVQRTENKPPLQRSNEASIQQ